MSVRGDLGRAPNLIKAGANYGWPTTEGPEGGGFADPLYAYSHSTGFGNGSITAVMIYDDGQPGGRSEEGLDRGLLAGLDPGADLR